MADKETVQVTPAPGQLEELAAALLRLADHPHDVVWQSRGGFFVVPEVVAVRYAKEQGDKPAGEEPAAPRSRRRAAAASTAAADAKAPRARASRKATAAAADTAGEDTPPRARSRGQHKKKGG